MPTILLLDVSLSMCKPVIEESVLMNEDNEVLLCKNLAILGCNKILDHFSLRCKLEFTALVIFSSLYEILTPFTRDFEAIKKALTTVEDYDKTNLQVGLAGASQHILEEWGTGTPCQIILITDGNIGVGNPITNSKSSKQLPLPFPFPAELNIVCITHPDNPSFKVAQPFYKKILDLNGGGNLHVPEGGLSTKSVSAMFDTLITENFSSYCGFLSCGSLSTSITLSPPPQPFFRHNDFEVVKEALSETLQVHGFLTLADVSSPPAFSRHLVFPLMNKGELATLTKDANSDDESGSDEGKISSFCVLLHGGLKREGLVALCEVGQNWFGILYSWADNKKKSNLMLSIFEPGIDIIPWIGKLTSLGPANLLSKNPYSSENSPFPLKATDKKSYAQNCVVWVRQGGLQSDIQKILRHARKLPEKQQSFYKELNRVRKAALMYGFPELMTGLASLLEHECYSLPANAHPEASIQLQHAAESLRACEKKDPKQTIVPFKSGYD